MESIVKAGNTRVDKVRLDNVRLDKAPAARSQSTASQDASAPFSLDAAARQRRDLLRRFASTPYTMDLQLMQRTVRLETNHPPVLELAKKFFEHHQHGALAKAQVLWRIVCESDPQVPSIDVPLSAFSDMGLRYVNIGQRGFLAVDLENREAVAFFSDRFAEAETRFRNRPPLDILFCMTAASLGLVALSGGCVGGPDRGVLIFGPPNSGKTTSCYLAAKLGLEFHADQVVFLDGVRKPLRAWGDPFPAVFRPETVEFLPELRQTARLSTYADLSFYYLDKSPMQSRTARPLTPVCSLFLDRGTARKTELRKITPDEAVSRLRDCMLFNEDDRFEEQTTEALTALAAKPIYDLRYDNDPKCAAAVIEEMLR
jgi:hypothetical protein